MPRNMYQIVGVSDAHPADPGIPDDTNIHGNRHVWVYKIRQDPEHPSDSDLIRELRPLDDIPVDQTP